MYSWQFSKKFPFPNNGGHFEFSNFCQMNVIFAIFKKISPPQKWRPFWIFEFLPKMAKHKFASISLTVRDRAISAKFSTHRGSKEFNLCNFPKIFPSPKMAAILNFRIFAKNGKTLICFLPKMEKHKLALTVQNRVILLKFSTHRVSKKCTLGNFQKNFLFPIMAAILNFQIFAKWM